MSVLVTEPEPWSEPLAFCRMGVSVNAFCPVPTNRNFYPSNRAEIFGQQLHIKGKVAASVPWIAALHPIWWWGCREFYQYKTKAGFLHGWSLQNLPSNGINSGKLSPEKLKEFSLVIGHFRFHFKHGFSQCSRNKNSFYFCFCSCHWFLISPVHHHTCLPSLTNERTWVMVLLRQTQTIQKDLQKGIPNVFWGKISECAGNR